MNYFENILYEVVDNTIASTTDIVMSVSLNDTNDISLYKGEKRGNIIKFYDTNFLMMEINIKGKDIIIKKDFCCKKWQENVILNVLSKYGYEFS